MRRRGPFWAEGHFAVLREIRNFAPPIVMLNVQDLSLSYGAHRVLAGLSFRLGRGELLCVCGESGSGKSSLLRAIMGFEDFGGRIEIGGTPLSAQTAAAVRRHIAYVPQELALPSETVEEMVRLPFGLRANRQPGLRRDDLLRDWAALGLGTELLQKRTAEISGGQRQRAMLAVAGLLGKSLLLADEPTSALDEDSAAHVLRYFQMLAARRQMAVLVVSHSPVFRQHANTIHLPS